MIFAAGVAAVLLSQLIVVAALVGVGLVVRRAFGLTTLAIDDLFDAFWMGFSAVILALMLWNFAFPVNAVVLLLVLASGAAGLLLWRRTLGGLRAIRAPVGPLWTLTFVVAALWVASQGLGEMSYFDSALYHMQAVQWAERYPVVRGLANLAAPLAYNNASLLYGAMLDVGPWAGLGFRLANGVLMQVFLLRVLLAIARLSKDPQTAGSREVFVAMLLPAAISLSFFGRLSSYATAAPTAIVALVIAMRLYDMLVAPRPNAREAAFDVVTIVILSAACVALKLSAAPYSGLVVVVALGAWLSRRSQRQGEVRRVLAYSLGAALLFGGAWTLRGVILSGYPAFPSRFMAAPVDWRVPAEHADAEYALVEHSSKASTMLDNVIAGRDRWGWLPRWTRVQLSEPFFVVIPLALAIVAALIALIGRRREAGTSQPRPDPSALLLIPIVPALVAWFWLAPEGRYAAGMCWALAALMGAWAWNRAAPRSVAPRAVTIAAVVVAAVTVLAAPMAAVRNAGPVTMLKTAIKQNVRLWEPATWTSRIPPPPLDSFVTQSGLVIGVPPAECWDATPPCTHNPARNLELRSPGDIGSGFRVTGEWAMQNWPAKSRPRFLAAWRQSRQR